MSGQHLPPDHSRGDERTLGGYFAVHGRPPAFEGADTSAYSVDIVTDTTGDRDHPWGAYLIFLRWSAGEPEIAGHLETDFLARGPSELAVRDQVGRMALETVKATLDGLIRTRDGQTAARPWWVAMAEEDGAHG
ncbi:MAG: hypothetical protein MUE41_01010 [Gemmatimonadaceae bacterium]|jgi:hypothetical protein|nr:hypothetical protein [Gemmatimonadaceae bacterium]